MRSSLAHRKSSLSLSTTPCDSLILDLAPVEERTAASDYAELEDIPSAAASSSHEHGVLPIVVHTRDGRRTVRAFRSRWSWTEQGSVDNVQMYCPDCSAPLRVHDIPLRVVQKFACQLICSKCS